MTNEDSCTRRKCNYTQEQKDYTKRQNDDFCEIICPTCYKKKWACRRCAELNNKIFAYVDKELHRKTKYAHSSVPRPSGKRVPTNNNNAAPRKSRRLQTSLLPKMKRPPEYLGKKRMFHSTDMVHLVHGFIPTISPITTEAIQNNDTLFPHSYEGGDGKPAKLNANDIRYSLPGDVWRRLVNLKLGGLCVLGDRGSFHVWKNKDKKQLKDTPIHRDKVTTLLIVVGGWGNKIVFIANSPGEADTIQDGIGNTWKKDKSNTTGSEVWHPTKDSDNWYELMGENIDKEAIIRKTLVVGDALLIPRGFLHGVLSYGDTTMLSISIDKI